MLIFIPTISYANTTVSSSMAADPLDVQLQNILSSPNMTPEQKEIAIEKYNLLTNSASYKIKNLRTDYYCSIPVTRYAQAASNWCGPATIYQTLKYINGTCVSQSNIASSVMNSNGVTTIPALTNYINNNQTANSYLSATFTASQTDYFSYLIRTTISVYDAPVVALLKPYKLFSSGYGLSPTPTSSTGMHFVNIRGQSSDGGYVYLVDPGYTVGGSGSYSVTRTALMNAILECDAGCRVIIY